MILKYPTNSRDICLCINFTYDGELLNERQKIIVICLSRHISLRIGWQVFHFCFMAALNGQQRMLFQEVSKAIQLCKDLFRKTFRKLDLGNLEMIAMPIILEKTDLHFTFLKKFRPDHLTGFLSPKKWSQHITIKGTHTLFKKNN